MQVCRPNWCMQVSTPKQSMRVSKNSTKLDKKSFLQYIFFSFQFQQCLFNVTITILLFNTLYCNFHLQNLWPLSFNTNCAKMIMALRGLEDRVVIILQSTNGLMVKRYSHSCKWLHAAWHLSNSVQKMECTALKLFPALQWGI